MAVFLSISAAKAGCVSIENESDTWMRHYMVPTFWSLKLKIQEGVLGFLREFSHSFVFDLSFDARER